MAIEARGVYSAHGRRGSLSGSQAAGEDSVGPAQCDRRDLVLHPIVISR